MSRAVPSSVEGALTRYSNIVQLISSIFLLQSLQIGVLGRSLLGDILQSLLLNTGLAFLFGGLHRTEQNFDATVAQTMGMFLFFAVLSLTIPTISQLWGRSTERGIVSQSRGTAVVIVFSYAWWLMFQLRAHKALVEQPSQEVPKRPSGNREADEAVKGLAMVDASSAAAVGGQVHDSNIVQVEDEEEESPQLSRTTAIVTIILSATVLVFNTEIATNSIQGIVSEHRISKSFMNIVILPLLSNDLTTIACDIKDKLDLSLALTLHRSIQTALMIVPLIVPIAWGMDINSMWFAVVALSASVIMVTYGLQEDRVNW